MKTPSPLTVLDFRQDDLEKARASVAAATGADRAEVLRAAAHTLARLGVDQKDAGEVLQGASHKNRFIEDTSLRDFQETFATGWKAGFNGSPAPGPMDIPSHLGEWDAGKDTNPIPPRGWLLGNTFCRRFVSSLTAGGGAGKTALRMAQALSLATGREPTGEHVFQRCRVLYVSLEDDRDELRRRVRAAMKHHGIEPAEIEGWLYLATPTAMGLNLAELKEGEFKRGNLNTKLEEVIELHGLDVVILDPFVKAHAVSENDNNLIDQVMTMLADIAAKHNVAIDVLHHVAKGPPDPGNADRGRGASALKDAARLVYTLTPMEPKEAETFGISEAERRSLVRMDSAKVNLAPPTETKWFKLVGVNLGNGTDAYPNGDQVQTVEPWLPPDTWGGLSHFVLNEILTAIDKGLEDGSRYSDRGAAKDRAAWQVVVQHAPEKTEKQARQIVRTWVKNGVLMVEEYDDPVRREKVKGLRVNPAKRPS
jgi:hypothetical protein